MIARLLAFIARREVERTARRALADDVAVRRMLVGVPYAKKRAAAMPSARAGRASPHARSGHGHSATITIAGGAK